MNPILIALLLSLIAGLSTTIGSFIAFFMKKPSNKAISFIMGFSAGVMILVSFVELLEMENNKQDSGCCGVSAYIACNEDSKVLQESRIKEAIDTGADYLITACPKCIAHFNCYLNEHKELKDKIKIMDLASFLGKLLFLI